MRRLICLLAALIFDAPQVYADCGREVTGCSYWPQLNSDYCIKVSLRDIEQLRSNIYSLGVSSSTINNISVFSRFASTLKSLACSNCNISNIDEDDLTGFRNLEDLDVSDNKLTQLNASLFKNTVNLKTLDLRSNNISTCVNMDDFSALEHLYYIRIGNNPHLDKSCFDMTVHQYNGGCDLGGSAVCRNIISSDIRNIPDTWHLKIVNSAINKITNSVLSRFAASLNTFTCNNCSITDIEDNAFKGLEELRVLDLQNNKLTKLNASLFKNIVYVDLRNNNISSCFGLDSLSFLRNVVHFNVEGNPFLPKSCSDEIMYVINGHCGKFPDKKYVCRSLGLGDIEKLPSNINHLEIIDIAVHNITESMFGRFHGTLKSLKCNNCSIAYIEKNALFSFENLEILDLADNKLTKLSAFWFRNNYKLREINLSSNNISNCVDFDLVAKKHFKNINVTNNPFFEESCLDTIQVQRSDGYCVKHPDKMYRCIGIRLSDIARGRNDIRYLAIYNTPLYSINSSVLSRFAASLITFKCNKCSIFDIQDGAFNGFKSLETLDFQDNKLTKLNFSLFKETMNLRKLSLRSNNISSCIDVQILSILNPFITIYIDNNPLLEKSCVDAIVDINTKVCDELSGEKYVCKHITSRDIMKLPNNIRHLEISDSSVMNMSRSVFMHFASTIESLQCDNCIISKIEANVFSGFKKLRVLNFRKNQLTNLNFSLFKDIPNLRALDLRYNNITHCDDINDLSVFKPLVTIDVGDNPLSEKSCLDAVEDINNNHCEQPFEDAYFCNGISLSDITKLSNKSSHVEISEATINTITSSVFSKFAANLEYFQCNDCSISDIEDSAFSESANLETLNLENNKLTKLQASLFRNTVNLRYLYLQTNNISSCTDMGILSDLSPFITIYIDDNPHLDEICLDAIIRTNARHCDKFSGEKYVCKGVSLKDIMKLPDNIRHLKISGSPVNGLTRYVFARFAATMESLQCNNCNISEIENNVFSGFKKLESLDLRHNKLTELGISLFNETFNLKRLDLRSNNISDSVHINTLPALRSRMTIYVDSDTHLL